jgi:hypothetical protein
MDEETDAAGKREEQEGCEQQHQDGNGVWQIAEAISSHRTQRRWESQEEKEVILQTTFNPEIRLEPNERAQLVLTANTEGYATLHRIFRSEVDKFWLDLVNVKAGADAEVIAKHKLAKAAAQFYEGATQRVNEEVIQYTAAMRAVDAPRDDTEGVLDIGLLASTFDDLEEDAALGEDLLDGN